MNADPELTEVVRREVGEALDELLSLTEKYSEGALIPEAFVRDSFRIFHNVKGALHLGGFSAPERIAHAVEDHLATFRELGATPDAAFIDLLEQALSACVYAVEGEGTHPELSLVLNKLGQTPEPSDEPAQTSAPHKVALSKGNSGPNLHETIRIEGHRLDRLMSLGSEYLGQHARLRRQGQRLREFSDRMNALTKRDAQLRSLVGELAGEFEKFVQNEEQDFRRVTQLTADFDRSMREVRMQPLSSIVPQVRRVVAEAARELEKSAHLTTDFGEVELDREVLDALREPLVHLLRNAIDHGLESAAQREGAGKKPRGEIKIEARVAGANVELVISDDGKGIDVGAVRKRAGSSANFSEDASLDDSSLIDKLLFSAGFSTAASVTNYSGRGVGLDVVRSRVTELGGTVTVSRNELGKGVSFTLSVPSSVVSLRGLCVTAGGQSYVLPNAHVERTLRVKAADLGSAEGSTIMKSPDGEPLRLRWLASEMQRPRTEDPPVLQIIVVVEANQRLGLVVDEVQGDTTYVIKRLPWNLRKVPGVIGATHQGGAQLALVVDPARLFRRGGASTNEHRVKLPPGGKKLRILVADDSLTSRTLERNILLEAGYDVHVEDDGKKALAALEQSDFDLLVSDVQMPNMDGIALARAVRSHARLSRLPIILVTSLDRPEDIALGAEVGADEYIIKGQFDQGALLGAVSRLL